MPDSQRPLAATLPRDITAGMVVFVVALPLCLGVALASSAPLFSGLLAGIVGGIVVGLLSGSHTSVSGPAAGLTAIVAVQIVSLGSFEAFLFAVLLAGFIQMVLGLLRAGFISAFFPSSVIKGLLAAIGVILILKQLPHLVGHDPDPEGDLAFMQPDRENTLTELVLTLGDIHPGAAAIGLVSVVILLGWERTRSLKTLILPAPLAVVVLGVLSSLLFRQLGSPWAIGPTHLVQVPEVKNLARFLDFLQPADFSQWRNPAVYTTALMIAAVASLETLLNLEAIDKIDPRQRTSPPSRELFAQGVGNVVCGLIGGLPVTSLVIRGSVNINAGCRTKLASVVHGLLLLVSVVLLPVWLNLIPLSCLAAVLLVTGLKLASPAMVRQMWRGGWPQFAPFVVTVVAIVLTDLLIGVLIGLAVSVGFILWSNVNRPLRRIVEKHLGGQVERIVLANQVSFLNRAALAKVLDHVPSGGHIMLDAHNTDYIDPDVLDLIRDFADKTGPARKVEVSLRGFRSKYELRDQTLYADYSTRDLQEALTPEQVLEILKDGNERFRSGRRLFRDLGRQVAATAVGQHPLAVVLSCIDSRTPAELILDLGVGDIFSVRVAGNVASRNILGSVEYACAVAGAKLVLVLGHTRCGAVTAAVKLAGSTKSIAEATGCQHLDDIVRDIQGSVGPSESLVTRDDSPDGLIVFADAVARRNVLRVVRQMRQQSETLERLVYQGRIAVVGAMYDVSTGEITFLPETESGPERSALLG